MRKITTTKGYIKVVTAPVCPLCVEEIKGAEAVAEVFKRYYAYMFCDRHYHQIRDENSKGNAQ